MVETNKFLKKVKEKEGKPFLEASIATKGEKNYTIGYGRSNENVKKGDKITLEKANQYLKEDVNIRIKEIQNAIPNFNNFSENLQLALFYEWYRGSLVQSPKTRNLINEGKFKEAANEFLNNDEYKNAVKRKRSGIKEGMEDVAKALMQEGTIGV